MKKGYGLGIALLVLAFAISLTPATAHAQSSSSTYYVASLDSTIDPGAQDFISSSVANAQSMGIHNFVLVLNTFGGDGASMDSIIQAMANYESAGGTFITLVGPYGASAFSAGAYIAEASTQVYMMNGTVIGSASPVASTIPTGDSNTTEALTTYIQALASNFGRNATATGLMVSADASYNADQALKLQVINGVINASSVSSALAQLGAPSNAQVQTEGIRSQL